jgi:hypothetical protein
MGLVFFVRTRAGVACVYGDGVEEKYYCDCLSLATRIRLRVGDRPYAPALHMFAWCAYNFVAYLRRRKGVKREWPKCRLWSSARKHLIQHFRFHSHRKPPGLQMTSELLM